MCVAGREGEDTGVGGTGRSEGRDAERSVWTIEVLSLWPGMAGGARRETVRWNKKQKENYGKRSVKRRN